MRLKMLSWNGFVEENLLNLFVFGLRCGKKTDRDSGIIVDLRRKMVYNSITRFVVQRLKVTKGLLVQINLLKC